MTVHAFRQPGHRTPEEIREQLEARYAELERDASKPHMKFPCRTCRWASGDFCKNALVVGLDRKLTWVWDRDGRDLWNTLCGPEKALWEPKLTFWQRIIQWLERKFS